MLTSSSLALVAPRAPSTLASLQASLSLSLSLSICTMSLAALGSKHKGDAGDRADSTKRARVCDEPAAAAAAVVLTPALARSAAARQDRPAAFVLGDVHARAAAAALPSHARAVEPGRVPQRAAHLPRRHHHAAQRPRVQRIPAPRAQAADEARRRECRRTSRPQQHRRMRLCTSRMISRHVCTHACVNVLHCR